MARILAIESTCDETAAAVVEDGYRVRSNVVASQAATHAKFRGVVPEIASRKHIESILPVVREALESRDEGGGMKDEKHRKDTQANETSVAPLHPSSFLLRPSISTPSPSPTGPG